MNLIKNLSNYLITRVSLGFIGVGLIFLYFILSDYKNIDLVRIIGVIFFGFLVFIGIKGLTRKS